MGSIKTNNTIFPDFMKIEICDELIKIINNNVEIYKKNVKEAVIYSIIDNKNIKSSRRVSHKTSFNSPELKDIVNKMICPLIYSMLKTSYPNTFYDISIGDQMFDYIKYENGGYFDKHKDFVRINCNTQCQYTMLIGLSDNKIHHGGNTILWFPVDKTNKEDFNILKNGNERDPIYIETKKKYNIGYDKSYLQKLFTMNDSTKQYLPFFINSYSKGNTVLFRSDIVHSGEEFYDWYTAKELFMLTINITGVENKSIAINSSYDDKINIWLNDMNNKFIVFDEFEFFLLEFASLYKLIPFQIIVSKGKYNDKDFLDIYLKYLNLQDNMGIKSCDNNILERINITLLDIYNKTKNKLNKKYREKHLESNILEEKTEILQIEKLKGINFDLSYINLIPSMDNIMIDINNYYNNFITNHDNSIIIHTETVNNLWEESSCNDGGDEYEEVAYLQCNIDIKFCFLKYL